MTYEEFLRELDQILEDWDEGVYPTSTDAMNRVADLYDRREEEP